MIIVLRNFRPLLLSATFVAASLLGVACDSDEGPAGAPACDENPASSTFEAIQTVIFDGYGCTNGACHGDASDPAGGLELNREVAYANLVDVMSNAQVANPLVRVYPGEQALSHLYQKLEAGTFELELPEGAGRPMPYNGSPLSEAHLQAVRSWIRAGAPQDGVVAGTSALLGCGLPEAADPNKIPRPTAPATGTGVQFISGAWSVPAASEDEVCFATYYDLTDRLDIAPDWARVPCPASLGGLTETCLAYNGNRLTQDPQSHHSIVDVYFGESEPDSAAWGVWKCLGGDNAGATCDPTAAGGTPDGSGGSCGANGMCASSVVSRPACIGVGPDDLTDKSRGFSGAQKPVYAETYATGVYSVIPARGMVIWNSHAFNLTTKDTTIDQYIDLTWARPDDRQFLQRRIFDAKDIFAMNVPPFKSQEICASYTLPRGARLTALRSHVHKRGVLWRTWLPPNQPNCRANEGCKARTDEPIYTSRVYDDSVQLEFDPPLAFDAAEAEARTLLYCAVYDNGETTPEDVKRFSELPENTFFSDCTPSATHCLGGDSQGLLCGGDDAMCGGGVCDACALGGGVTTEDEMFLFLGSFYVVPTE